MSDVVLHREMKGLTLLDWSSIVDDKDLSKLIISGNPTVNELNDAYYELMDEYISKYGNIQDFKNDAEEKKELAFMMCDYIETLDRFKEFEINVLLSSEDDNEKEDYGDTIKAEKGYIEKELGFYLPWNIPVEEYYAKKKQATRSWRAIRSETSR